MKGLRSYNVSLVLEKLGDLCFDLAKMIFAGVILAAVMQLDINAVWLFCVGFAIIMLSVIAGCILFRLSDKNK